MAKLLEHALLRAYVHYEQRNHKMSIAINSADIKPSYTWPPKLLFRALLFLIPNYPPINLFKKRVSKYVHSYTVAVEV